jgi:hypothetical protein
MLTASRQTAEFATRAFCGRVKRQKQSTDGKDMVCRRWLGRFAPNLRRGGGELRVTELRWPNMLLQSATKHDVNPFEYG